MPKKYLLISCEIFFREICFCLSQCRHIIDVVFMPKGLHDIGEKMMSEKLQAEIDKIDPGKYEAVLLGYGLCNNGIRGLHAPLPLIVPRAHDCITLLLGSKEKYYNFFDNNPGTYFKSTGWIERDSDQRENSLSITSQLGMNKTFQEYVELYGEEQAKYLMETIGDWFKNYKKIAYIDTQIGNFDEYKLMSKKIAEDQGWEYEELSGNTSLLMALLNGNWNEKDFLTIPVGKNIQTVFDRNEIINFE